MKGGPMSGITDVVMFSGGVGSWAAGKRVVKARGSAEGVVLLFTDTMVEDDDLHRFLDEAAESVGAPLVKIADGRTPFDVFHDMRWIGNSRVAHCSAELKQKPAREWIEANCDPDRVTIHVGIDWTEIHRMRAVHAGYAHRGKCSDRDACRSLFDEDGRRPGPGCRNLLAQPWSVNAPLTDAPLVAKGSIIDSLKREGIEVPRMYREGFPHNNCGKQGCVRGGKDYWKHYLLMRPEEYLDTERREEELREEIGSQASILTETVNGEERRLPLAEIRRRAEAQPSLFDGQEGQDWGGCGCMMDDPADLG